MGIIHTDLSIRNHQYDYDMYIGKGTLWFKFHTDSITLLFQVTCCFQYILWIFIIQWLHFSQTSLLKAQEVGMEVKVEPWWGKWFCLLMHFISRMQQWIGCLRKPEEHHAYTFTFTASSFGSVGNRCSVGPSIQNQQFLRCCWILYTWTCSQWWICKRSNRNFSFLKHINILINTEFRMLRSAEVTKSSYDRHCHPSKKYNLS